MIEAKAKEIRDFCVRNSDPVIIEKYSRYFKGGFNGYGLNRDLYETQSKKWIADWKNEMSLESYLDMGDQIFRTGKHEEKSFVIRFVESERSSFSESTFDRIGNWFEIGIDNWATTDVLCMILLPIFINDKIISLEKLKEWNNAQSEWQRRSVPVTLNELARNDLKPAIALPVIEPLMLDESEYVRKGLGTLLRELWKKYPEEIETFLLKWKDQCGRLIIQYATEKMDKEYRKKFRKTK